MTFKGPLKARKKVWKMMKWQVISMILPLEDLLKQSEANSLFFSEKVCIKEYLWIEETQVVCCGHPRNIYFMLNSTTTFHCVSLSKASIQVTDFSWNKRWIFVEKIGEHFWWILVNKMSTKVLFLGEFLWTFFGEFS